MNAAWLFLDLGALFRETVSTAGTSASPGWNAARLPGPAGDYCPGPGTGCWTGARALRRARFGYEQKHFPSEIRKSGRPAGGDAGLGSAWENSGATAPGDPTTAPKLRGGFWLEKKRSPPIPTNGGARLTKRQP